ncbi:MAG TPA: tetratricopeptide repeat protein [Candidatus Krumholzibacteria bacterium]|nr:tetratricopeptide repeat protein [Candidatus Krumholzibacteria bacterium]
MSSELKFSSVLTLIATGALVAGLVTGCGTDEEVSQTGRVAKDAAKPVATQPVDVARTPAPSPAVTVPVQPEPPRVVTYAEAEDAYQHGRYAEAVELFDRYVESRPGNPWGHYMLGLSAWKAGRLDEAETAFQQALALDTTHEKSYVNLARVLLDAGRPGEAYTAIDNALVLDDGSSAAWRVKGRVCHALGRTDEAVAAYRRAIAIDPDDAWSMNNLAFIYIQQERFDDALAPLARAVELKSDVAVFHNNLGMALERTGHLQAAEDAYASAIAADPSNAKAGENGTRLASVLKDADADPVDLPALALAFKTAVESWNPAMVAANSVTDETATVTAPEDSTGTE